jgi:sulfite exporter TauE/SafE
MIQFLNNSICSGAMFELLFYLSIGTFIMCFLAGVVTTFIYEDNAEKLFKWYNYLVSTLTWSVFVMIPLSIIVLIQKILR